MHLGTRSLTLSIDDIARTADVSDARIISGPSDLPRLLGRAPFRNYRLQCTAAQDLAAESLWSLVWLRAGEEVDIELRPAGGTSPSEDQPWFAGTVTIAEPDGDLIGGEANASPSARFAFAIDWAFTHKPVRIDA
ncbi:hypothetical protein [Nocardioides sp.]|uniref:hypothetical protein n=1 Tax=Nocardioides sp. TaxID=35761 RepID=UPI002B2699C6|nr:hypothetical protein [Nocardioides sp.]